MSHEKNVLDTQICQIGIVVWMFTDGNKPIYLAAMLKWIYLGPCRTGDINRKDNVRAISCLSETFDETHLSPAKRH
ncbi:hypothetical protein RRG08_035438 [Elysia crispata]|uniref:Uncharacterized protein n=1 Tax=Elysia crispata TaxID=231223 RepID=A0AAE0Y3I7_9GAST|nr:hypothetical protein RRG08_035438 [Elysia crispata]